MSAVGRIGQLSVATRGRSGAGEVIVRGNKGVTSYLAWSANPLEKGSVVLIIGTRGIRTVDVEPWVGLTARLG